MTSKSYGMRMAFHFAHHAHASKGYGIPTMAFQCRKKKRATTNKKWRFPFSLFMTSVLGLNIKG